MAPTNMTDNSINNNSNNFYNTAGSASSASALGGSHGSISAQQRQAPPPPQQQQQQRQAPRKSRSLHPSQFVDLKDQYNAELLQRFYRELMIPNFPMPDELEPLEVWEEMFEANNNNNNNAKNAERDPLEPDFHVVLALDNLEDKNPATVNIMGGVVFEYYSENNCGILTYLLVNNKYRGRGLSDILVTKAVEVMGRDAKARGHLAGCDAIFLETNSAEKVKPDEDVMIPAIRHAIFHKIGLRLLDFDYVQPPLSAEHKSCSYLLLCVLLTPHIPKDESGKYYLPSSLLKSFMRVFWEGTCKRLGYRFWNEHPDYLRIMDQLSMREKIPLLDLPWERPFTIVDMRQHFDLDLMVRFYIDFMAPNFPKDELEPLEHWLKMLYPSVTSRQAPDNSEDFHVLLALKYPADDEHKHDKNNHKNNAKSASFNKRESILSQSRKPIIVGGVSFEYYGETNCGLLTYLLVSDGSPNSNNNNNNNGGGGGGGSSSERMARALVNQAIEILDQNAKSRGHLAGCNAIFLETASVSAKEASSTSSSGGVIEFSHQHSLLAKMGFRMVDFDYVQPPLSVNQKKSTSMSLTVMTTSRIPKYEHIEYQEFYLPRSLLRNFLEGFWSITCSRAGYKEYANDPDYKRMMDQIQRRDKVPLLELPWERPWTIVEMDDNYDPALLKQFHDQLVENAQARDEIEPLDQWRSMLEETWGDNATKDFHVLLALKYLSSSTSSSSSSLSLSSSLSSTTDQQQSAKPIVVGGLTFKYYPSINCGLLNYISVDNRELRAPVAQGSATKDQQTRADKLAWALMEYAVDILDTNAKERGHLAGCNAIFLETVKAENIVSSDQRYTSNHESLYKMGWRLVDVDYVRPSPLVPRSQPGDGNGNRQMALTVFMTSRIPKIPHDDASYTYFYLPRSLLHNFITTHWAYSYSRIFGSSGGNGGSSALAATATTTSSSSSSSSSQQAKTLAAVANTITDPYYLRMMAHLNRREKIPVLDLPWTRNWTLIDLREDFDVDLLRTFYKSILKPNFNNELKPLDSYWEKLLSDEISKESARIVDLHVLLAIQDFSTTSEILPPANSSTANVKPNIVGGATFEYHSSTNCGFITHLLIPDQNASSLNGELVARELVEEAVEILDQNAKSRGHIAGCNAIFMELRQPLATASNNSSAPPNTSASGISKHNNKDSSNKVGHHQLTDISNYQPMLYGMGWRYLDFMYVQPPFSAKQRGKRMVLTAFLTPRIPKLHPESGEQSPHPSSTPPTATTPSATHYIPHELIKSFVSTYWINTCGGIGYQFQDDELYAAMMDEIESKERILLLNYLPTPLLPQATRAASDKPCSLPSKL